VKARVKRGGGGGQHLDSSEDENGEEKGFGHPVPARATAAAPVARGKRSWVGEGTVRRVALSPLTWSREQEPEERACLQERFEAGSRMPMRRQAGAQLCLNTRTNCASTKATKRCKRLGGWCGTAAPCHSGLHVSVSKAGGRGKSCVKSAAGGVAAASAKL